jgi:lysophospholipase L1-like esterase
MEIAEGIGAIVLDMETRWPEAEILLLGIFPRSTPDDPIRDELDRINEIIARLDAHERVHYLDIGEVFMDDEGVISRDIMSDLLHPSSDGYELWAEAVKEPLAALLD